MDNVLAQEMHQIKDQKIKVKRMKLKKDIKEEQQIKANKTKKTEKAKKTKKIKKKIKSDGIRGKKKPKVAIESHNLSVKNFTKKGLNKNPPLEAFEERMQNLPYGTSQGYQISDPRFKYPSRLKHKIYSQQEPFSIAEKKYMTGIFLKKSFDFTKFMKEENLRYNFLQDIISHLSRDQHDHGYHPTKGRIIPASYGDHNLQSLAKDQRKHQLLNNFPNQEYFGKSRSNLSTNGGFSDFEATFDHYSHKNQPINNFSTLDYFDELAYKTQIEQVEKIVSRVLDDEI